MPSISCPACGVPIPEESWNQYTECESCSARVEAITFPALYTPLPNAMPEAVGDEGEASCFYHPANRAVVPCDGCGKFLCALCDLDLDGRHLCHECLDRGIQTKAATLEDSRVLYDSMALGLTTWPLITIYLPLITAPVALFLAFRHMGEPGGVLPRTRVRWWIAIVLAVVELLAWTALLLWAFRFASRTKL